MSGSTSSLRARVRELLEGASGVAPWLVPAGRFHAAHPGVSWAEQSEAAIERGFDVSIDSPTPTEPVNTLSGYALYSRRLRVRVGYLLRPAGDDADYEATGEQSGAADRESVEDRADADGVLIRGVIGSLRSWAGLSGVSVIDVRPDAQDPPEFIETHAIYTHPFTVLSRDALPGAYGPTL